MRTVAPGIAVPDAVCTMPLACTVGAGAGACAAAEGEESDGADEDEGEVDGADGEVSVAGGGGACLPPLSAPDEDDGEDAGEL